MIHWQLNLRGALALLAGVAPLLVAPGADAQPGEILWEDGFETLDNWMPLEGNGSWGWGNGELQYYQADNVSIAAIPGEPGNTGLRIEARAESGPGIVDQWGNPLFHTSGRVSTRARVAVRYGVVEARVRVPDLDLGGWPALWMLGTSTAAWPRRGEIDLMEMGHAQAFRDLHDGHNGGDGSGSSTVNQAVAANAIYYADAAVSPENPSGAASLAWDPDDDFCRPYYNLEQPLDGRFLVYRLYWDESSLRFTVEDGGVERDLYAEPFAIDAESDEFRQPFHLLANLAIGGALTDAWNLGDPGSGLPVSLPLPAVMWIDYVRVRRWNGQGEVFLGPPPAAGGDFGVFTDETPVDDGLVVGETADVYVWEGTLVAGGLPPWEGEHVLSWAPAGLGGYGAGVMSRQPVNLSGFEAGELRFRVRMPAHVTFKVGAFDVWGNAAWVEFPAHATAWGLVRDGEWGQAVVPVAELRTPELDLRMLSYEFAILEEQGAAGEFALDDILWTGGAPADRQPAAVAGLRLTRLADGQARLDWPPVTTDVDGQPLAPSGYRVEGAAAWSPGLPDAAPLAVVADTAWTDPEPPASGGRRFYRVRALAD